jgi:CRISPR-associated protein (TIGR03984 family)
MKVEKVEEVPAPGADLREWIAGQMTEKRPWLLAHFDDGVLWGRRASDGSLLTSFDVAGDLGMSSNALPEPRLTTLQQAFIFGGTDEVRLWRDDDDGWQARRIADPEGADRFHSDKKPWLDEEQLLWGDQVVAASEEFEFTRLREGRQQGLEHCVPLFIEQEKLSYERRVRLLVRHYITYDVGDDVSEATSSSESGGTGEARIALSRLVALLFD